VIPVWFTTAPPGLFDESSRVGGLTFDPNGDHAGQITMVAELLRRKLAERRNPQTPPTGGLFQETPS
jgi:hypothetical protein